MGQASEPVREQQTSRKEENRDSGVSEMEGGVGELEGGLGELALFAGRERERQRRTEEAR